MPPENSVTLGEGSLARAYALPARLGGPCQWAGVKWTAHRPALDDGLPAVMSVTMVNDATTGLPMGIVESALLTATRTAAVSALVLQHAASAGLRRVTLLGAGVQAATHVRMLAALFPNLHAVTLWNRTADRARALAAGQDYPWPVHVAEDLAFACSEADAVITCTAASTPILNASVMRPGRTILQVGYHETSFDAIDRADVVLVDLWGEFRLTSAKSPVPDAPGWQVSAGKGGRRPRGAGAGWLAARRRRHACISPASASISSMSPWPAACCAMRRR